MGKFGRGLLWEGDGPGAGAGAGAGAGVGTKANEGVETRWARSWVCCVDCWVEGW